MSEPQSAGTIGDVRRPCRVAILPQKLDYSPPEGIKPHGFSGAGVWAITASNGQLVWGSDPALLGMVYKSFESLSLIAAVKLPKILELLPSS
jgi:hypothetical protein